MTTDTIHIQELIMEKSPTGIKGLDEITYGGLPKGRPTLVCGGAGCGKTLLAIEFLVQGATVFNEPGLFMSFEETAEELTTNVASVGFDLSTLVEKKMLALDYIPFEQSETEATGRYNPEDLFNSLNDAIDRIGAKRVVFDTIGTLFPEFSNPLLVRSELRRFFRWLSSKGVTSMITAESGDKSYSRFGIEEYVSDCVILLDHRISEQSSTRHLRVAKYRGSSHVTREFPFLITENGFSILPITSIGPEYPASSERVSCGIPRLDTMLDGKGFYRGSSVLVSGTAGPDGVLTGTERLAQEEKAKQLKSQSEIENKKHDLNRKRKAVETQIALLQLEFETEEAETLAWITTKEAAVQQSTKDHEEMAKSRKADVTESINQNEIQLVAINRMNKKRTEHKLHPKQKNKDTQL